MTERPRGLRGLIAKKEVIGAAIGGIVGIIVLAIVRDPNLACWFIGGGAAAGAVIGSQLNHKPT